RHSRGHAREPHQRPGGEAGRAGRSRAAGEAQGCAGGEGQSRACRQGESATDGKRKDDESRKDPRHDGGQGTAQAQGPLREGLKGPGRGSSLTPEERQHAGAIWRYCAIDMPVAPADFVLALGCHDERVAERAADLLLAGIAPRLVLSGGFGKITRLEGTVAEA